MKVRWIAAWSVLVWSGCSTETEAVAVQPGSDATTEVSTSGSDATTSGDETSVEGSTRGDVGLGDGSSGAGFDSTGSSPEDLASSTGEGSNDAGSESGGAAIDTTVCDPLTESTVACAAPCSRPRPHAMKRRASTAMRVCALTSSMLVPRAMTACASRTAPRAAVRF